MTAKDIKAAVKSRKRRKTKEEAFKAEHWFDSIEPGMYGTS